MNACEMFARCMARQQGEADFSSLVAASGQGNETLNYYNGSSLPVGDMGQPHTPLLSDTAHELTPDTEVQRCEPESS